MGGKLKRRGFSVRHGAAVSHCSTAAEASDLMLALRSASPATANGLSVQEPLADGLTHGQKAKAITALADDLQWQASVALPSCKVTSLRDVLYLFRKAGHASGLKFAKKGNELNTCSCTLRHFNLGWAEDSMM